MKEQATLSNWGGLEVPEMLFNGTFTPEVRSHFRMKRLSLGLTYEQLGAALHINYSTIRKWEDGRTIGCHSRHVNRVNRFLKGGYDRLLGVKNQPAEDIVLLWQRMPPILHVCLERAATIYELCGHYPELRDEMVTDLSGAVNSAIRHLLLRAAKEK
jgi:hypothetical protein